MNVNLFWHFTLIADLFEESRFLLKSDIPRVLSLHLLMLCGPPKCLPAPVSILGTSFDASSEHA